MIKTLRLINGLRFPINPEPLQIFNRLCGGVLFDARPGEIIDA